jgi:hypothetical protein
VQRGRLKYGAEVKQAVQRALAAIRRDPLRTSTPLESSQIPLPEILTQLRFLLKNDHLQWEAVPYAVEQALQANQDRNSHAASASLSSISPSVHSSPTNRPPVKPKLPSIKIPPQQIRVRRDTPVQPTDDCNDLFGWDDPLYNSR